ncbi:hypothetical protein HY250_00395 [Candidatus Azambacteria bacterium]|nr:hypothetical protein [Candidatus Azambacteria bacterium]MBI3684859.1 hypothetical protein [Candidatus Azambacteria bacterium]
MKYIIPIIISLPVFLLPFLGNRSISWEMVVLIFGYFWVGVALGEEIGKGK